MELIACWLAYPAVLLATCLGCGLLVDALAGRRVPGLLLAPVGFTAVVVVAQFAVAGPGTARLALPLVVALALAGWWAGRARLGRPDRWALATAAGTFLAFAAPVLASGAVTWTGFLKLDDTVTWWALLDRVMEHGRDHSGLAPSSYRETLRSYIDTGYPLGALLPLGVTRPLVGQDLAWVYQPYMATIAALLALTLHHLLRDLVAPAALRAAVAFTASQAALLYGYVLWGGVKEVAAAMMLPLLGALLHPLWQRPLSPRAAIPLALAAGALMASFNSAAGAWLGPAALVALAGVVAGGAVVAAAGRLALVAGMAALASLPALALSLGSFNVADSPLTAGEEELGNLLGPLQHRQALGIWPATDFRLAAEQPDLTNYLIVLVALAALAGAALAVRRRAYPLLAWAVFGLAGTVLAVRAGSPWVDSKALAIVSPLALTLALGGAAGLATLGPRVLRPAALTLAALIAGGVLWSNVRAYAGVSLAPNERMAELEHIGERFAGESPALITEYVAAGSRHFLREMDAEGATDLRYRPVRLVNGELPPNKVSMQIDDFALDQVLQYRALVLRRMPNSSRPPSSYERAYRGRYYDVWLRGPQPVVVTHRALGGPHDATAVPSCTELRALAREAAGGRLVTAARPRAVVVPVRPDAVSPPWSAGPAGAVRPNRADTAKLHVVVPATATWWIWVGGSFARGMELSVDGRPAGRIRDERQHAGQFMLAGRMRIAAGRHVIGLRFPPAGLRPGGADTELTAGPVVLQQGPPESTTRSHAPAEARALCGRRFDWVEILARRP